MSETVVEAPITQPVVAPPVTAPDPDVKFTAKDLENARKQEKDKVYDTIDALKAQLKLLTDESEARKKAAEDKAAEEKAAADAKRREEASAKDLIAESNLTWEQKFEQIQAERALEREVAQKERELFALQQYIQRRVTEESDNIAPELLKFVTGNNESEVEASIANVKAATNEIVENFQATITAPTAQPRGVPVTGYTAAGGPFDTSGNQTQTLSPEAIRNMGMAEFAELRKKIGLGQSGQGQGLFG